MIPTFERIDMPALCSVHMVYVKGRKFAAPWHFHPEYELVWIVRSNGRRFVGDSAEPFEADDLVLMGPYLPHFWRNDPRMDYGGVAEAVVVQFGVEMERFLGSVPEGQSVVALLQESRRGVEFSSATVQALTGRLTALREFQGLSLLLEVVSLLQVLSQVPQRRLLVSKAYQSTNDGDETERMKCILDFMVKNYDQRIQLREVAALVDMHPSAFCRYFKQRMGRSFVDYLNAHRVEQAKRLLSQGRMSVRDVAAACGFRNLSNYHRRFREHAHTTPLGFEKTHRKDHQAPNQPS
jgi:AraC-like DNA-binding protein